jgi:hypothetical protein
MSFVSDLFLGSRRWNEPGPTERTWPQTSQHAFWGK